MDNAINILYILRRISTVKLMAVLVLLALITVSGTSAICPWKCTCTKYKTYCTDAEQGGVPHDVPNTTEFLEIINDNIVHLTKEQFQYRIFPFLQEVTLFNTNISRIEESAFEELKQLKVLRITANKIESVHSGAFSGLSRLTFLDLSWNHLQVLPSHAFQSLSMMRDLDLHYNQISELPIDIFSGSLEANTLELHVLQSGELNLSYNYIRNIIPGTFKRTQCFTHLNISFNEIEVLKKDTFIGLRALKDLDLTGNPITFIEKGAFNGLRNLGSISLYYTKLGTLNQQYFEDENQIRLFHLPSAKINDIHNNTFGCLTSLVELELQYNTISIIRSGTFRNMKKLRILDLSNNNVTVVGDGCFRGLSNLSELSLSQNFIETLSVSSFHGLTNLKILGLQYNRLAGIAAETFKDQILMTHLNMEANNIEQLSENQFCNLISLEVLDLSSNEISFIDERAFRCLKSLRKLYLGVNNLVSIVSGTFSDLNRLDVISLSGNKILTVSSGMFLGLNVLRILNVNVTYTENLYRNYTENYTEKYIENLSIIPFFLNQIIPALYVSDYILEFPSCNMTEVKPGFLHGSTRVDYILDFRGCRIKKIHSGAFRYLYNFTHMNLEGNELSLLEPTMFEDMISLESLDISYNNISTVHPNTFRGNTNLKTLRMDGNRMLELPPSALAWPSLQEIYLNYCNISSISPLTFTAMPNLTLLQLAGNNLKSNSILFGNLKNLKYLWLCENYLTHLDLFMFQDLKSLLELDVSHNQISVICEDAFTENKQLKILDLSENEMLYISENFLNYPSIEGLNLYGSNISYFPTFSQVLKRNLIILNLHSNNLKELDFESITSLRNLKYLDIRGNSIPCDCTLVRNIEMFKKSEGKYFYSDCWDYTWQVTSASLKCEIKQNFSETINRETLQLQSATKYIEPVILGVMFLIGISGNTLLIFIFALHSEVRTISKAPILNLAIADFLSLIFNLAMSFVDNLSRSWKLGLAMCKLFTASRDLIVGVSVYSVVSLCLQRYSATVRLNRHRGVFGLSDKVIISVLIVGVWVMSFCFAVPAFISTTVETRCLYVSTEYKTEYIQRTWTVQLLVYCIIPAIIILFFYIRTAQEIKASVRNFPGEIQDNVQTQKRLRSANIVIGLTALFCISYGPNFLLRVLIAWSVLDVRSDPVSYVGFVTYCLFFCNTCFNPIALYSMSGVFRCLFNRYLLFWRCCQTRAAR